MSVISTASKNATRRSAAATTTVVEANEFDGFWLNIGVRMGDDVDSTFVRLPRGVAVSDLKPRKIYESMDPDFAAQTSLMNSLIEVIQGACAGMAEGESKPLDGGAINVVLYRRQEEAEVAAAAPQAKTDLIKALFG